MLERRFRDHSAWWQARIGGGAAALDGSDGSDGSENREEETL